MEKTMKEKMDEILKANTDLRERLDKDPSQWSISYNKKADMVIIGEQFPAGTFYFPVHDTGVMVRIDNNNKIYGFAIENAKYFMRKNPEMALPLSVVVNPIKFKLVTIPMFFVTYHTLNGVQSIITLTDFVTRKLSYSNI